jgi:hypothetical protein
MLQKSYGERGHFYTGLYYIILMVIVFEVNINHEMYVFRLFNSAVHPGCKKKKSEALSSERYVHSLGTHQQMSG